MMLCVYEVFFKALIFFTFSKYLRVVWTLSSSKNWFNFPDGEIRIKKGVGTIPSSHNYLMLSRTSHLGLLSPRGILRQEKHGGRSVGSEKSPILLGDFR